MIATKLHALKATSKTPLTFWTNQQKDWVEGALSSIIGQSSIASTIPAKFKFNCLQVTSVCRKERYYRPGELCMHACVLFNIASSSTVFRSWSPSKACEMTASRIGCRFLEMGCFHGVYWATRKLGGVNGHFLIIVSKCRLVMDLSHKNVFCKEAEITSRMLLKE